MSTAHHPEYRELTREEIDAVLGRNHVGRIAYATAQRVDIEPINYVYEDGWIFGRTAPGTKLTSLSHNPWVAFEVDEVTGLFDWTSVVAHGTVYLIDANGAQSDRQQHEHALAVLRAIAPDVLTEHDPAPHRTALFRIHLDERGGRTARSGRRGGTPKGSRFL